MITALRRTILLTGAVALAGAHSARAASFPNHAFATQVAAYVQGSVAAYDTGYSDIGDWTGVPSGTTGAVEGFPGVVTPFFPPFDADQILVFGSGGHLTLKFPAAVPVGNGPSIGIFSTCGFVDSSGQGTVGGTVSTFGGGLATVRVSGDGIHWASLGVQNIDIPQCYYPNAGAYDVIPPNNPLYSDYGQPYIGGLASFANQDMSEIEATFNGSAGGTWLDTSSSGLSQIDFVDFSPPPDAAANWQLAIQAIASANPILIPEPSLLLVSAVLLLVGLQQTARSRG